MRPKMQSAIEKITLNDATFTGEIVEPTFVNFFYGKNGAGKSTIARTIKANNSIQWQDGKSAADYDVLVYDTDFINANLQVTIICKACSLYVKPILKFKIN